MCLALALTSARLGANVLNHTEIVELTKGLDSNGKPILTGAKARDRLTGRFTSKHSLCNVHAYYVDLYKCTCAHALCMYGIIWILVCISMYTYLVEHERVTESRCVGQRQ